MADIEDNVPAARPPGDSRAAGKVQRLIRPAALTGTQPLFWTPGIGADLWDMFCASITGDLSTVERLNAKEPALARAYYEYRTALAFAVRENQVAVAAYLLDHGAEPWIGGDLLDVARQRGYTEMARLLEQKYATLHHASPKGESIAAAIRERDLAKARRLLDEDPELLDAGDAASNRPIHWAVMTRQLDVIDELLARGADINAQRADGARPIQLTNGDYGYRGWLLENVATTPRQVLDHLRARGAYCDICTASYIGDLEQVRELLAGDPSLANRLSDYVTYYPCSATPLRNAAGGGHIEVLRLLLEHGADPNLPEPAIAPRGHALYAAVYNGHYEVAKLLLERGAYPNPSVESSADAVGIAIMKGDRRMIALLASYGATWEIAVDPGGGLTYHDVVSTGLRRTPAVLAQFDDVAAAEALFAADPALADDEEALARAAGGGHEEFVRLLLRHQPDLAKRVTVSRPREMARLLFAHGMDPNRPNWLRLTPLHQFAEHGDIESAALFLTHGADIHARDEELCATPLGWAANFGHTRMVEFLLRRGARPRLPDDPPWATPLALATYRGHESIVQLLTAFEQTGTLPRRDTGYYDALARDFVEAYATGEEALMNRLASEFRIARGSFNWDRRDRRARLARLRRYVRERLGTRADVDSEGASLALSDAQLLIAREHGFEGWTQLVAETESTS